MRVAVITIGCRLNQSEGDGLRTWLEQQGNQVITKIRAIGENQKSQLANEPLATVYLNTCAVTEQAARTSRKWIRRIVALRPKPRLVVTGCLAQVESERLKKIKGVDEIISQTEKVELIKNCPVLPCRARVFLKIQDGCLNHCAYCLPAQIRGKPISKPIPLVKTEIENLVAMGFQEIVLVGLNLGAYGLDTNSSLFNLLKELEKIKGDFRIRLGCLEPDGFDGRILKYFDEFRLCHHLHIPLQSGDDKILRLMHRKYTVVQYQQLITKIVETIPDINIGTDIITGFPGEDEASFLTTLNTVRNLPFGYLHIFPYSPRPGTSSFRLKETCSPSLKHQRVNQLRSLSQEKSFNYRRRFKNQIVEAIIEPNHYAMADHYIRIALSAPHNDKRIGRLAKVLIREVTNNRTFGELVSMKFKPN